MSTYMIVAYQTVGGAPLRHAIDDVIRRDPAAEFTLLVPATRTQHLFTWTEGEAIAVAQSKADAAAERLTESGVPLTGVKVGDPDPLVAVEHELRANSGIEAIIVSTFPPGLSRWLRADLPRKLEKRTGLPVTHVVVGPDQS